MTKILITGANGLLGQKLVQYAPENAQLLATGSGEQRVALPDGVSYATMDICQSDEVMRVVEEFQPDCIVHAAAMTHVDRCEQEPDACRKINVLGTQNVAAAAKKVGAHIVHISTDFIFDGLAGPYSEGDFPNPLSVYGASKWESEEVLSASGAAYTVLRTMLVFGYDQTGKSNIVLWAKSSLEKGEEMRVVDDQFRAPTLADDLAVACYLAFDAKAYGVYHIAGADVLSIREMVRQVAEFWNLDDSKVTTIKTHELGQPAPRPPYTGFVLDLAVEELGYEPKTFMQALEILDKQLP